MNKTLRKILIASGAGLIVVAVLALALPYLVPMEAYRGRIESAGATATGRALRIEGQLRLTLFPHFGIRAKEVTLANVPGGRAAMMVDVGDIYLGVKILPLLSGQIALQKIVLDKPTIALEVDVGGNPNWNFGKENPQGQKKGSLTLPNSAAFSGIEISDGKVTYDNAKTGTHRAVEHVNLKVDITTIDQPVSLTGNLVLSNRSIDFTGRLATLKTFLGSGTTAFEVSAEADLMKTSFKGQMYPDGLTDGAFKLDSPSLRDLSGWLGQHLPAGGLGPLSLSSRIQNKDKITHFENLRLSLDKQNLTGTLAVDTSGELPVLTGALASDRLDLNPYLEGGKAQSAGTKQKGWSRAPISFALVKEFNGKLTLSTGALRVQSLHLGRTALRLEIQNGVMHAVLDQVSLYGGAGQGETTLDVRGAIAQFSNHTNLRNVALKPFLADMLHLDTIEGQGTLTLDLRFAGNTSNAIMHSLSGKGALAGANGRFRGVDLGAVARSVQAILGGGATGSVASTDFHTMGADFTLAGGVLATNDFKLAGPMVEMAGQGTIDIGNRGIDFRLRPGAAVGGMRFGVPFHIRGSWDKLHYAPDMAALIGGAVDNLKEGSKSLTDLFTGGQKNDGKNDKKKNMGDRLKDLFGIH